MRSCFKVFLAITFISVLITTHRLFDIIIVIVLKWYWEEKRIKSTQDNLGDWGVVGDFEILLCFWFFVKAISDERLIAEKA